MHVVHVDVAVIGAGTAGLTAYKAAIKNGAKAVLIESGLYGTTCARVGCMPSKLLIAAAEAAHMATTASAFGVHLKQGLHVNGQEVMARVKSERDRFVGFVLEDMEKMPQEDRIRGHARFVSQTELQIDEHTRVKAKAVVIATGSSPVIPQNLQALGERLVTNEEIFYWDTLPGRVAVFGPGVIGLELGQALSRLGVDVRVFGSSGSLAGLSDPQVKNEALQVFQEEFYLDTKATILDVALAEDGVQIRYVALDQSERVETFDYVIAATGRKPNLSGLGLENARLPLDSRGIPQFDRLTMQVGNTPVFIAGDANGYLPLLHEAADEGFIAGRNAARFPQVTAGKRTTPLSIVFTDPQVATVGKTLAQLEEGTFVTGAVSFRNQGRSRVMLKNKGLMHLYADIATHRLLGAQMIGPSAEHLAHLLAWSVEQEMTIDRMLQMPFYHPVIEEGLRTALRNTLSELKAAAMVSSN